MIRKAMPSLQELYHSDETAWLEEMAQLAARGDRQALDLDNLSEYLTAMARRDQREVLSRLLTLLVHLLKWEHQPEKRGRSWELTIQEQREELQELLTSATLRQHAERELATVYRKAVRRAAVETKLQEEVLPTECPWSLDQLLST